MSCNVDTVIPNLDPSANTIRKQCAMQSGDSNPNCCSSRLNMTRGDACDNPYPCDMTYLQGMGTNVAVVNKYLSDNPSCTENSLFSCSGSVNSSPPAPPAPSAPNTNRACAYVDLRQTWGNQKSFQL